MPERKADGALIDWSDSKNCDKDRTDTQHRWVRKRMAGLIKDEITHFCFTAIQDGWWTVGPASAPPPQTFSPRSGLAPTPII